MRLRKQVPNIDFEALRKGQRRALAKAITLIESTNPAHRREAAAPRGDAALEAGGAVVDEVHVSLTTKADAVVRVRSLVEGTEVLEVEVIGHVDVGVAAVLVGVPVPAVSAVVAVRGTAAAATEGRVEVLDFRQTRCETLVAVGSRRGVHAVVAGEGVGSVEPTGSLLQVLTLRAGRVLVSRGRVVDVDLASGVVLELKLVRHVVEDHLVGAQVCAGVTHVVPFNDEHLVGVTDLERGRRGLHGVGGRDVR